MKALGASAPSGYQWRRCCATRSTGQPGGRVQHTTRLTAAQREIFAQLGVAPPAAVTALDPA